MNAHLNDNRNAVTAFNPELSRGCYSWWAPNMIFNPNGHDRLVSGCLAALAGYPLKRNEPLE
jgi:hypothetical protein